MYIKPLLKQDIDIINIKQCLLYDYTLAIHMSYKNMNFHPFLDLIIDIIVYSKTHEEHL